MVASGREAELFYVAKVVSVSATSLSVRFGPEFKVRAASARSSGAVSRCIGGCASICFRFCTRAKVSNPEGCSWFCHHFGAEILVPTSDAGRRVLRRTRWRRSRGPACGCGTGAWTWRLCGRRARAAATSPWRAPTLWTMKESPSAAVRIQAASLNPSQPREQALRSRQLCTRLSLDPSVVLHAPPCLAFGSSACLQGHPACRRAKPRSIAGCMYSPEPSLAVTLIDATKLTGTVTLGPPCNEMPGFRTVAVKDSS